MEELKERRIDKLIDKWKEKGNECVEELGALRRDLYHLPPLAKSVNNGRNEAAAFMNK